MMKHFQTNYYVLEIELCITDFTVTSTVELLLVLGRFQQMASDAAYK